MALSGEEEEGGRFLTLTRRLHGLSLRLREAEEALRMREREIGELRVGLQEAMEKIEEARDEREALSEALEALRKDVEALKGAKAGA